LVRRLAQRVSKGLRRDSKKWKKNFDVAPIPRSPRPSKRDPVIEIAQKPDSTILIRDG
jgi:hypothetical protein